MLRRRSIRTKLVVALGLLSAIVVLLALSSFWGLHRYRSVAEAIGQGAAEIPLATALNRSAEALKATNEDQLKRQQNEAMIDTSAFESGAFYIALDNCQITLSLYEIALSDASPGTSLFVDSKRQKESLQEIRASLDLILEELSPENDKLVTDLPGLLESLVKLTGEHLKLIQGGMTAFSEDVRGQYRTWIAAAWFFLISAIVLLLALVWLFTSLIVQPFRTLLDGSRLVASGQFDHRIDLGAGDELCELAEAMNDMTDRFQVAYRQLRQVCSDLDCEVRQRTREVIQNEQLASVGFLAAGVAHEINNPLATIAWSAESLESRIEDIAQCETDERLVDNEVLTALQTNLRRIQEEAFRCKGITERLLDFSRLGEVKRAPTDLSTLVQDVVEMVSKVGKYRCKTLRADCDPETVADVNPQEIRQVVLNLLTNALESVGPDGAVDVQVRRRADHVLISVVDNGCGMTPEVLQHLFEPFFTRRSDGSGTGLGLSISYRIISQHGGTLAPHSDGVGKGSRLDLTLPVRSAAVENKPHPPSQPRWNHESYQAA